MRSHSPQVKRIKSLYAPGGALDSQTTESQWYDGITGGIEAFSSLESREGGHSSIGDEDSNGWGIQALRRNSERPESQTIAPPVQSLLASPSTPSLHPDIPTRRTPPTTPTVCACHAAPRVMADQAVQTSPYPGCSREHLAKRFRELTSGPCVDANGEEYVPDSDGEASTELRLPSPRKIRLTPHTYPCIEYPGTRRLYNIVKARAENQHLVNTDGQYFSTLFAELKLQELTRHEYLQRVVDGLEPEPHDRALVRAMRPYNILLALEARANTCRIQSPEAE
ncbi:hypothetical protein PsYK624_143770 [Phanerochaete sordida]|uniref:Uncharacterized protein n=1 Tax=Phanerochaete sordida TaxID=48140 RepID=A0A9P3LKA8_9APHY|nr:hypothetical protein PsYK624_143770 [Phanerochaete sordida]